MITIAKACDLIVAQRGLSVGAAQKTLRQAGASGEVRSTGVHLNLPIQLSPADWRVSAINFEAGIFDQLGGLLPGAALAIIREVTVDEGDLRAWLGVKPPSTQQAHKGGAPATVAGPVKDWYEGLSEADLSLSDNKLAAIYQKENPSSTGQPESIRKIIGGLRRERARLA
jgi:hypothetical protein